MDYSQLITLADSSPALQSGGLQRTHHFGLQSTYYSGRLQSGTSVRRTPADPPFWTSVKFLLQSGTPVRHSPADSSGSTILDFSQLFTPADSVQHSPPKSSGFTILDFSQLSTLLDSGGLQRTHHVMICDICGLQMSPDESGGLQPGHVGDCKVLHRSNLHFAEEAGNHGCSRQYTGCSSKTDARCQPKMTRRSLQDWGAGLSVFQEHLLL